MENIKTYKVGDNVSVAIYDCFEVVGVIKSITENSITLQLNKEEVFYLKEKNVVGIKEDGTIDIELSKIAKIKLYEIDITDKVNKFFEETRGITITNTRVDNKKGLVTLDFIDSCGGGASSVGDFTMDTDDLINQVLSYFDNKEEN